MMAEERDHAMAVIHLRTKGQLTLPKRIRDAVGLGETGTLLAYTEGNEIVLRALPAGGRLHDLVGILPRRPQVDVAKAREDARHERGRQWKQGGRGDLATRSRAEAAAARVR